VSTLAAILAAQNQVGQAQLVKTSLGNSGDGRIDLYGHHVGGQFA
jgi:hypothetical protein